MHNYIHIHTYPNPSKSTLEGDFQNLLAVLAEQLSTEDNLKLQPVFGDGTDETAHEILVSLEKRSHFSVDNIQPLEDLLMNLHRDDLIVKCLIPFKHKHESEKTTALSKS